MPSYSAKISPTPVDIWPWSDAFHSMYVEGQSCHIYGSRVMASYARPGSQWHIERSFAQRYLRGYSVWLPPRVILPELEAFFYAYDELVEFPHPERLQMSFNVLT